MSAGSGTWYRSIALYALIALFSMTPLQYYEPTAFNIRPTYAPVLVVSIVTSTIPRHLYCVTTCIFSLFYFITCWLRLMRLTTSNKQKRSVYDHESMIAPPIAYDHGSRTLVFLWLWRWSVVGSGEGACPSPDYRNKLFVPTQHPIFTPGPGNYAIIITNCCITASKLCLIFVTNIFFSQLCVRCVKRMYQSLTPRGRWCRW